MPIYEYTCRKCTQRFEQLIRRDTVPACPSCGGSELDKLVSTPIPPGKTAGIVKAGRAAADREGHFSHYKRVNGKPVD